MDRWLSSAWALFLRLPFTKVSCLGRLFSCLKACSGGSAWGVTEAASGAPSATGSVTRSAGGVGGVASPFRPFPAAAAYAWPYCSHKGSDPCCRN
eukprot:358532-Chlamydomonas_euryale.AAC.8